MPRRFEKYRMKDGRTRLSEATFNPIFNDIDLRIAALEAETVSWKAAIGALQAADLTRVAQSLTPLIESVAARVAELDALAEQINLGAIADVPGAVADAHIGERTADPSVTPNGNQPGLLTQWLNWLTNRIKAITGGGDWYAAPATTLAAAAAHMVDGDIHPSTAAQVGAPSVNGAGATGTWPISISGAAASVPWSGVTSRPTALSQFTNDITMIKSIQRGTISSSGTQDVSVTIGAVNPAKTFVNVLGSDNNNYHFRLSLVNATTLRLDPGGQMMVGWEVIEFV